MHWTRSFRRKLVRLRKCSFRFTSIRWKTEIDAASRRLHQPQSNSSSSGRHNSNLRSLRYTPKGQIMSECIFEIINFPKYHQNNLIDFCPGRSYPTKACMPSLQCRSQILIGCSSDSILRTVVHTVRELQL